MAKGVRQEQRAAKKGRGPAAVTLKPEDIKRLVDQVRMCECVCVARLEMVVGVEWSENER